MGAKPCSAIRCHIVKRWQISPARYRSVCVAALALLCIIVVSGAAVRLTGSGLGCNDWPRCNDSNLIDVSSKHSAIEQINRLFTGLVSIGVVLAVLGSLVRVPGRRDLTWWSLGLVAGVIGQIVLGGITVLVDLHPAAVQSHFLVSMVLVANGVVLVVRSAQHDGPRRTVVSVSIRRHVWVVAAFTFGAIALGTVVTGSGPHAGDEKARRFGLGVSTATQLHSVAIWSTVFVMTLLVMRLRHRSADRRMLDGPLTAWVGVAVAQGAIGYIQYFSGVPAVLVAVHVAGATALWAVTVWLVTATTTADPDRAAIPSGTGSLGAEALDEGDALVDHR